MKRLLMTVLMCAALASAAQAAELKPLAEAIKSQDDISYPLVRCAAFYQATAEWAGSEQMGPIVIAAVNRNVKNLLTLAIFTRMANGKGERPEVTKTTHSETRTIAESYKERFEAEYERTGHAWGEDPLWNADAESCNSIVDRLGPR